LRLDAQADQHRVENNAAAQTHCAREPTADRSQNELGEWLAVVGDIVGEGADLGSLLDLLGLLHRNHVELEEDHVEEDRTEEDEPVEPATLLNVDDGRVLLASAHQIHQKQHSKLHSAHDVALVVQKV